MAEKPSIGDQPEKLEPDEIEELEEERADERYMAKLTKDKHANYAMLRKLRPVTDDRSLAVMELTAPYTDNFFETLKRLARFKEWKNIEGGEIQIRESVDVEDTHGYVVIRPEDDKTHEIVIRVWNGFSNSAIILPRSDKPLPHHGRQKDEILEQMRLVSGKELDAYDVWLEQLRKAE
jgi:hypothetical protein